MRDIGGGGDKTVVSPRADNRVLSDAPAVVDPVRGTMPVQEPGLRMMTREVDAYLRSTAHDYDSIKDVGAGPVVEYEDKGWSQLVDFRAKNASGAYVKQSYRFIIMGGLVVEAQAVE